MTNATQKTRRLVQLAILVAIMLILAFTPLGYLKVGAIEITFMTIPVVIGTILLGPPAGAFLGGVFGLTSFIQCFGMSAFGSALLGINPIFTFLVCMVPRILMGYLAGLIFQVIAPHDKTRILSFAVSSLSGALLNTILFVGLLMLFFGYTDYMVAMRGGLGLLAFLAAFVGVNGLVEAVVAFVLGTAISKALVQFLPKPEAQA